MSHLKAVYFLRPTSENVQLLRRQLANPRFGEYHLCKLHYLMPLPPKDFLELILSSQSVPLWSRANCDVYLIKQSNLSPQYVGFYSFFQHIEGHTDSHFSRF